MKEKTTKVLYYIFLVLFSLLMLFSGIASLIAALSGDAVANKVIIDLGYPVYVNIILGTAKILGVIALIVPGFRTIKEWAYAGFTFDILGATFSFGLNGDGIIAMVSMLPFVLLLFLTYLFYKKSSKFKK